MRPRDKIELTHVAGKRRNKCWKDEQSGSQVSQQKSWIWASQNIFEDENSSLKEPDPYTRHSKQVAAFGKEQDKLYPYQSNTDVVLLIGCNCPRAI